MENLTAMLSSSPSGYTGRAWIGLTASMTWTWEDGRPASFLHWMVGQPDNLSGSELCAVILGGFWMDVSCSLTNAPVCFDGTSIIIGSPMTWTNADAYCKSRASSLAEIPDDAINAAIFLKMTTSVTLKAWIGLRKTQLWHWSDTSQNYTFRNWEPGHPDHSGGQDCAAVAVTNGSWTDEQCSTQYPFFCYDVYKSWSVVVRMTIQSETNLGDPASSDAVLQQLHVTFANGGVTDLKLTWKIEPVEQMQERLTSKDHFCLWML
ncbi:C-type mannose receptor 2-like [Betta splendens]|uniref:C-type mannose receptor 2-like n=1 Tax=Betta splendens TaxID=158456 RepID=A0A9W2XB54_BETSP|nr:C-type mannose receptor 2-like [Betta splendens]